LVELNKMLIAQGKTNWKYILIVVILAVIVGGVALWCSLRQELPYQLPGVKKLEEKCNFSKEINLRKTTQYGIFGDDAFDTVVCGYSVTETAPFCIECEEGEPEIERASIYFVIIDYLDEGFKKSIEEGIEMGNTVNYKDDEGNYRFNLGCLEEGKITADTQSPDYINKETQEAILKSTPENPISIILSFEEHFGRECFCCSLAEKVRLY